MTVAAGFPTTVNPIIQYGAIPVFIDTEIGTYVPEPEIIKNAISNKTKAIFLAHTLGNPFRAKEIREIADEFGLWLVEDNCDALGSTYLSKKTGTFGHLSTLSFYPAHQITTGEGGAILTDHPLLYKIAFSFRNWGRDCWCPPGKDNTCGKRFKWKMGKLPYGYDHKYIYSECGFNLKMTDMQAAIGVAQMKKLDSFVRIRKENFAYLKKRFIEENLDEYFILPQATSNSDPCWFGFPLTLKGDYSRTRLLELLDKSGVSTRLIFGGNLIRQPYFVEYEVPYKIVGTLKNTDKVMEKSFWIGLYPALKKDNLEYAISEIKKALKIITRV
ncbi:MAG: lipopolysaccharide biosynthesis protein RfbH [Candidatus Anstonellaceae archaeon]